MKIKSLIPKNGTQVFGRDIKITFVNKEDTSENKIWYGAVNLRTSEIYLRKENKGNHINKDEIEITYIHELMHYILTKAGYSQKLENAGIDEEELVEMIAVGLYDAIKNSR